VIVNDFGTVVASYNDATPSVLVATRNDKAGRVAVINTVAASKAVYNEGWAPSTATGRLIYNTLRWAAGMANRTAPNGYGATASNPGTSCREIKFVSGTEADGVYYVALPTVGVKPVHCLMRSSMDGGGWMLMMKAGSSGSTFAYASAHWTTASTLNTASLSMTAVDAKFDAFNHAPIQDAMALFPDLPNGGCFSDHPYGWTWLQNGIFGGSTSKTALEGFAGNYEQGFRNQARLARAGGRSLLCMPPAPWACPAALCEAVVPCSIPLPEGAGLTAAPAFLRSPSTRRSVAGAATAIACGSCRPTLRSSSVAAKFTDLAA